MKAHKPRARTQPERGPLYIGERGICGECGLNIVACQKPGTDGAKPADLYFRHERIGQIAGHP